MGVVGTRFATDNGGWTECMGYVIRGCEGVEPIDLFSKILVNHELWNTGEGKGGSGAARALFESAYGAFNVSNMFTTGCDVKGNGVEFFLEHCKFIIPMDRSDIKTSGLKEGNELCDSSRSFNFAVTFTVVNGLEFEVATAHEKVGIALEPQKVKGDGIIFVKFK